MLRGMASLPPSPQGGREKSLPRLHFPKLIPVLFSSFMISAPPPGERGAHEHLGRLVGKVVSGFPVRQPTLPTIGGTGSVGGRPDGSRSGDVFLAHMVTYGSGG